MNKNSSLNKHPNLAPLISLLLLLALSNGIYGQGAIGGGGNRIEGKAKFMPIPYINYDRSIEFTFGAVPMLMFNPVEQDTISPSSIIGAVGIYTTNKTWFLMGFGSFYFNEDKWRITAAGGRGTINFQFYLDNPINAWLPYRTKADFAMLQINRKIYDKVYGGIGYTYVKYRTSIGDFPIADTTTLHGISFRGLMDERDNLYYPRNGFYANINFNTFPDWFKNEETSNKIEASYNHYISTRQKQDVLAVRLYTGLGIGELSFNQQFVVGGKDIRGYSQGAFRGEYLLALQGEYRWNFHERIGVVGFLGVATIFEALNEDDNGKLLPAIGTGFRYTFIQETQFKAGIDIAAGVDDWGIYFRVNEAF
jgi:outer membrane protein assembly factor BamA